MVKLGGSAISDKSRPMSYNRASVRSVAGLVKRLLGRGWGVVLIHGGGSFAHPVAMAYGLDRGIVDDGQLIGVPLTLATLNGLNSLILVEFAKAGIPTYTVKAGSIFMRIDSEVEGFGVGLLVRLMGRGVVPVIYGDVIFDSKRTFSIISGDEIMYYLARELKPKLALFLIDLPGVFEEGPGKGSLIRVLKPGGGLKIREGGIDVTGGLSSKLSYAFKIAEVSQETYICSATDEESLNAIAQGLEPPRCTRVVNQPGSAGS